GRFLFPSKTQFSSRFTLPIHASPFRLLFLPSSFLLHSPRRLLLLFFTSGVATGLRTPIRKHPPSHVFRSSPPAKLVKFLLLCPWEPVKKIQPSSWIVLLDQPEGEGESST
ncbi:hypothetical protein Gotur_030743, partial [Gossypium turneri]